MIDQLSGQTLAGKYRIEELWRENAVSKTYHAIQISIDKPVTVKTSNPALAEIFHVASNFQTEARILSRIANPHILNVLNVEEDEHGTPFLVLETSKGYSLREFIREMGVSPLERATVIVRQIADALTTALSNNVVHGNLSSDKILITQRGRTDFIQVLDFGAENENRFDDERTVARPDLFIYKSPEHITGDGKIDSRTDVYALGVLLFELLTGVPPFIEENPALLAQKHLRDIPPSLIAMRPDLPPQIEQVVQRALAKQPNQRFQSSAEFSEALTNAAHSFGNSTANFAIVAETRPTPPVELSNTANNPYKTAFIVLIGIVTLSVFAIYLTGGLRNTPTTEANFDVNAQPVQPLSPASSNGEDLSNLGLQPLGNSNLNPMVLPPGSIPPGGAAPPIGGIPPGLYPGGGQTVIVPGNSNSIFMGDLNSNLGSPFGNRNRNANVSTNTNLGTTANINAAPIQSPRPANSNAGSPSLTPAPSPAVPISSPRPRATPRPTDAPTKSTGNESSKSAPN